MSKVYEALQYAYTERQEAIPSIPIEPSRSQPVIVSTLRSLTMEREMVQLQQRLVGLLPNPQHNILQFISCREQEGVSSIAQEFARVFAEKRGKSVLLVDGDSQKNMQHHFLGITPKTSLKHIMNNGGDLSQAITPVIHSNLFLALLSGDDSRTGSYQIPVNSQDLWIHIRKQFELIVIDSPSMDSSDEGLELCSAVDGVVMVVEAEKTRSQVISHLKDQIDNCGGKLLGMVFTKQRYYIPNWVYRRL